MKSANLRTNMTPNLGVLLRHWRDLRGRSQLDLSLDTGISQKQISFVESGRSVPSRQTLMTIAQALDIPLRDRNTIAAGGRLRADVFRERVGLRRDDERDQCFAGACCDSMSRFQPWSWIDTGTCS